MSTDNNIYINNTDIIFDIDESNKTEIVAEMLLNTDYEKLINLPSINGKILKGDMLSDVLELANKSELNEKEDVLNKTDELSSNSTEDQYPNAKVVYSEFKNKANVDLSNLNSSGEKMICEKSFFPNIVLSAKPPIVLDNSKLYDEIYFLKRSTFASSKFTIVGSPSITECGIASGFSSSDRIQISNVPTFDKPFKITFKVITGDLTSGQSAFYSNGGNYYNAISVYSDTNKYFAVSLRLSDNADKFLQVRNVNSFSNYTGYFQWTGEKYILHIDDLGEATYNSSLAMNTASNTTIKLGCLYTNEVPFTGSIDLTQFSITVDGREVFNGNKTGLDVIKEDNYTVVGSPTITEDGVASGFSSSDYHYVKISNIPIGEGKRWKLQFKAPIPTPQADNQMFIGNFLCGTMAANSNIWFQLFLSDDTNYRCYITVPSEYQGTYFDGELSYDGVNTYTAKIILNDKTELTNTFTSNAYINLFQTDIGRKFKDSSSIDLNAFKIYVDGKLVYQPCLKIPYNLSKTGSKIVPAYARDRVIDLYEQEGQAGYYTIDEENKNFTLPMGEIYGMIGQRTLRSSVRDGINYCEIYSDKTIEQGGSCTADTEVTLQQPFADTNYVLSVPYSSKTATSFTPTQSGDWVAKGKGV